VTNKLNGTNNIIINSSVMIDMITGLFDFLRQQRKDMQAYQTCMTFIENRCSCFNIISK
jgi:hypothetical protein